jgi:hypothetical protein
MPSLAIRARVTEIAAWRCALLEKLPAVQMQMNFTTYHGTPCSHDEGRLCSLAGHRHRGFGFDYRRYEILCDVVSLEWDPLSLVRITEELLE